MSNQMDMDKIPVIILNWNNFSDTKECIDSILSNPQQYFHTYLIDNASNKEDIIFIKKEYSNHPSISVSLNKENIGFAKAHNIQLRELMKQDCPFVFLLNNDTFLPQETAKFLKDYNLEKDVGMVSFKMINYWNRDLMDNAGHKMLSSGEIIPIGHEESIDNYKQSFDNLGACAGATLYSVEMLKDIGLFDDYFETGYEDAELGLRAFIAGYRSTYEPNAIVFHKMGQSVKKVFNYDYTLKIQTNIFYTYLKLVHWQVIAIHFLPFLLRFLLITLIDIVFWRPKYLKVQYHALFIILFRDAKIVWKARREAKSLRRISWWKLLMKQEFFLARDIKSFYKFIIKGEKSYFEKY